MWLGCFKSWLGFFKRIFVALVCLGFEVVGLARVFSKLFSVVRVL